MFCLAKVMPKTRFFGLVGLFGLFWGPAGPMTMLVHLKTRKNPQNLKMQKKFIERVLTQIFFQASQAS